MAPKTPLPCELREGTWIDFRKDVEQVNPELFHLIEAISPDKYYRLIKATYLYGESITHLGTICVPDKHGHLSRLDHPNVSLDLKEKLGYCPTPLMVQLTNASEAFVEAENRIIPLNVFLPGDLFGLYEILVPFTECPVIPCWSITSGGRSVFLAAKVSDAIGHKNLKREFGVPSQPPKTLDEHWDIIKAIANRGRIQSPWMSEVLIFTREWFREHSDDIHWLKFQNYLQKMAWIQSRGNRVEIEYSIMWESFAKAVCRRNLKPNAYIVDTIKHLMLLTTGTRSGFKFVDDSEIVLPSRIVEKAYVDIYGLKEYAPLIMFPHVIGSRNDPSTIYYSMAYPTLLAGTPAIRKAANIMIELRLIRTLMMTLERVLASYEERIYEAIKNVIFNYFHSDKDRFGEVLNSQEIAEKDNHLLAVMNKKFKGKIFPCYGPFFRGCISISKSFK